MTFWEVLHLKAFLWSEPLLADRKGEHKIVIPQQWKKQTSGQRWGIELFLKWPSWKNHPFFLFLLRKRTQNYSRISTLHKIMIIKVGNIFLQPTFQWCCWWDLRKAKNISFFFHIEIKIVSSYHIVFFTQNEMCGEIENLETLSRICIIRQTFSFVVQRNRISDIKFEIKYRERVGGGEARKRKVDETKCILDFNR